MNIPRVFKSLLKLCGIVALTLLMIFGAILSCGKNNMTKTTPQQAAAKNIKEVSKMMLLESRNSNDKRCFKLPPKWGRSNFHLARPYFILKILGIFLGLRHLQVISVRPEHL